VLQVFPQYRQPMYIERVQLFSPQLAELASSYRHGYTSSQIRQLLYSSLLLAITSSRHRFTKEAHTTQHRLHFCGFRQKLKISSQTFLN
jgi:hypothetical protein